MRSSSSVTISTVSARSAGIVAEHLEVAAGDRDRRPQLVGDVVEEPALRREARLEPIDHVVERERRARPARRGPRPGCAPRGRLGDPRAVAVSWRTGRSTLPASDHAERREHEHGDPRRTRSGARRRRPRASRRRGSWRRRKRRPTSSPRRAGRPANGPHRPALRSMVESVGASTRHAGAAGSSKGAGATEAEVRYGCAIDDRVERLVVRRHVAGEERVEDGRHVSPNGSPVCGSMPPASAPQLLDLLRLLLLDLAVDPCELDLAGDDDGDHQADEQQHVADDDAHPDAEERRRARVGAGDGVVDALSSHRRRHRLTSSPRHRLPRLHRHRRHRRPGRGARPAPVRARRVVGVRPGWSGAPPGERWWPDPLVVVPWSRWSAPAPGSMVSTGGGETRGGGRCGARRAVTTPAASAAAATASTEQGGAWPLQGAGRAPQREMRVR